MRAEAARSRLVRTVAIVVSIVVFIVPFIFIKLLDIFLVAAHLVN